MLGDVRRIELLAVLRRCRELLTQSEDSDWSCMSAEGIAVTLSREIRQLEKEQPIDVKELKFLFVVTGPLQETAMSNGWSQEYLTLAERFDVVIDG